MTDRAGLPTTMEMDDLELVTRYLNRQLDAETAEQVRMRLETDRDFYYLAEPLLFAWSVPRHADRHPRPDGELEKHWEKFTRRAGFAHQRRKKVRRRLWLLGILFVAVALPSLLYRKEIRTAWRDWRDYELVQNDTGWITLRDSNQVQLAPGARLLSSKRFEKGVHYMRLEGSARFRVHAVDTTTSLTPVFQPIAVRTRAGVAFTGMGEFTVTARGDTTDVEVHRPSRRKFLGFLPMPTQVLVETKAYPNPIALGETQAARLVRGGRAERTKR